MTLCRSALTVLPGHLSGEQSAGNCSVKESKIARVVACGVLSLRLIRAGARGGWYRKADRGPEVRPPGSPAERCEHGGARRPERGNVGDNVGRGPPLLRAWRGQPGTEAI